MATTKRKALENDGQIVLATFLKDQVRAGLPALLEKGPAALEQAARRMSDAQLRGVAVMLKRFAMQPFENSDAWYQSAFSLFTRLHLLESAMRRIDQLPEAVQQDVYSLMGRTITKKQLLAKPDAETISDNWCAAATLEYSEPDNLRARKQWLYGLQSGRTAFILDYVPERADWPDPAFQPGTIACAAVSFYPAHFPQRALLRTDMALSAPAGLPAAPLRHWAATQEHYALALARNVWLEEILCYTANMTLLRQGDNWYLADRQEKMLPVDKETEERVIWRFLALSSGYPVSCLLLYTPYTVKPLGILNNQHYLPLL
jgi:hypothetical protein